MLLLLVAVLLLLYYDRHHLSVYSYWQLQTLAIYMHLLHIYSFYSCWQGGYLYAFTAYLFFLQLLASYTRKRRALVMSLEIPRISLKFLSKLYILQILATCIVLCVFAGYLIKGYHYLIAQSSNSITFEKFFFPEP